MPTRLHNYREGDRSEYLAVYLLSALGLVTQVPRQEDIGFDLVCSVADQETGRLTFNHQYLVSLKSKSSPNIVLKPDSGLEQNTIHIQWLYRLELPFFLGVVDKRRHELALYSTLPIWFIPYGGHFRTCGSLRLCPRLSLSNTSDVGIPSVDHEKVDKWRRPQWTVDLGHPILKISYATLADEEQKRFAKNCLRRAISYARLSRLYREMEVPFFYWMAKAGDDGLPHPAFYGQSVPNEPEVINHVHSKLAPPLISLAMLYKDTGNTAGLQSVTALLRLVPRADIPDPVILHLPEIFGPSP